MPQIFHPRSNALARATLLALGLAVVALAGIGGGLMRSPYATDQNVTVTQPVPFSHAHHAGELGIDCRYCHTAVMQAATAGVPPTKTCMTCHSQIWTDSPMLEPVRASFRTGQPLVWERVHRVPGFVYFHHGAHLRAGVACVTCHGPVSRMPLTRKAEPMTMQWCLECHRQPEAYIRPREAVLDESWQPSGDRLALGRRLIKDYAIHTERLTDCSVCHR